MSTREMNVRKRALRVAKIAASLKQKIESLQKQFAVAEEKAIRWFDHVRKYEAA